MKFALFETAYMSFLSEKKSTIVYTLIPHRLLRNNFSLRNILQIFHVLQVIFNMTLCEPNPIFYYIIDDHLDYQLLNKCLGWSSTLLQMIFVALYYIEDDLLGHLL